MKPAVTYLLLLLLLITGASVPTHATVSAPAQGQGWSTVLKDAQQFQSLCTPVQLHYELGESWEDEDSSDDLSRKFRSLLLNKPAFTRLLQLLQEHPTKSVQGFLSSGPLSLQDIYLAIRVIRI